MNRLSSAILFFLTLFSANAGVYAAQPEHIEFSLKAGEEKQLSIPSRYAAEISFISGLTVETKPEMHRRSVAEFTLKNEGKDTVSISEIAVNNTRMAFNIKALRTPYKDLPQEKAIKKIFWDNFKLTHHADYGRQNRLDGAQMWNGFGFGLCFTRNIALNELLNTLRIKSTQLTLPGHSLSEYTVNGKQQIYDFDKSLYYPAFDGTIAGQETIAQDPYIAYWYPNSSPSKQKEAYFNAVTLANPVQKSTSSCGKIPAGWLQTAETLTIGPGEKIVFTDLPAENQISQRIKSLWPNSTIFFKRGYAEIHPAPNSTTCLLAKKLPFLVDSVSITSSKNTGIPTEALIMDGKETVGAMQLSPGKNTTAKLTVIASDITIAFFPKDKSKEKKCDLSGLMITLNFSYNTRALLDIKPETLLRWTGQGEKLFFDLQLKPDFNNTFYAPKTTAVVKPGKEELNFKIQANTPAAFYEYFLSEINTLYPVAPAFYFTDKTGATTISSPLLPAGNYEFHWRTYHGNGYWSVWQKTKPFHWTPPSCNATLQFIRSGKQIEATVAGSACVKQLYLAWGRTRFFPFTKNMQCLVESKKPEGGNELGKCSKDRPEDQTKIVAVKPDMTIKLPPEAAYYRFTDGKRPLSRLFDTRAEMQKQGIPKPEKLVLNPINFKLQHYVENWPVEHYWIVKEPDSQSSH